MHSRRLASFLATACWLIACANGGDLSDGPGDDGGGVTLEASSGHDSGPQTGNADTGTPRDASPGVDASASETSTGDDAPSTDEASVSPESGTTQDSGTTTPESGTTTPDTGTTSGGVCGSSGIYAVEFAAAVASGTFTLCLSGVCASGQCCYEALNPGNVCVKE
jgi:hypothetical protein